MKAFRTISLFVVALIAAVSCSETVYAPIENSLNAAWVGKTRADVIRSYGAPDRESSDGENGMILIYERGVEQSYASSRHGVFESDFPDYNVTTYYEKDYTHFYVNEQNSVYLVKSNLVEPSGKKIDWPNTILVGASGAAAAGMLIWYLVDSAMYD